MNVKLTLDITSRRPGGVVVHMSCRECPTTFIFPDVVLADIGLLIQRWENHSHSALQVWTSKEQFRGDNGT